MKTITFTVTFFGGKGAINFSGEGFADTKEVKSEDGDMQSFTVEQDEGHTLIPVTGVAPDSADGKITVEVKNGSTVLSAANKNTFKGLFVKFIIYDIN